MNANFFLIPVFIAVLAYAFSLFRKYRQRSQYVENKHQEQKDRYTEYNRSALWVYDHFVFPYIMMFNPIMLFNTILYLYSDHTNSSAA